MNTAANTMHRITDFFDTDLGAGILAFAVLTLCGIGAICVIWPDCVLELVKL